MACFLLLAILRYTQSMEGLPKTESLPELKAETISGSALLAQIYDHDAHMLDPRFTSREQGGAFHYSPVDSEITNDDVVFSVVRENDTIVGLAKMRENPRQKGTLWLMSISVDMDRKNEGISRKVLEEVFQYAKSNNMKIEPSSYTVEGEERVKHQVERLAAQYGVELV